MYLTSYFFSYSGTGGDVAKEELKNIRSARLDAKTEFKDCNSIKSLAVVHPVTELHIYVFLLPTPSKIQISVSNLFLPRLFFINTNLHFTQHNWWHIRTIELTTVTEFLEASQPPCIRCIFQIFYPRKSNKGVKMSWQREVKPKWVGISKWGSDSGKNSGGRPLDALFGACQHLSNLDLIFQRKIQIFLSEIETLLSKGI